MKYTHYSRSVTAHQVCEPTTGLTDDAGVEVKFHWVKYSQDLSVTVVIVSMHTEQSLNRVVICNW